MACTREQTEALIPNSEATFGKWAFPLIFKSLKSLERVKGIEPSYSAWKAAALPLSYTRNFNALSRSSVYRWHVSGSQISRIILPDCG
jgi:hypothetical protein